MNKTTLIEFPCHFPIKIIGLNTEVFITEIVEITIKHFSTFENEHLSQRASENSNYLALTVTVFAENQESLDAYYKEITKHPDVKMVL